MRSWYVSRKQFWIYIGLLLLLKYAMVMAIELRPELLRSSIGTFLGPLDNGIGITVAMIVGARFADVGWPRWLGIALVVLVMFVLPLVLLLSALYQRDLVLPSSSNTASLLDFIPDSMWIAATLLLVLLIVAGMKSGKPREAPLPVSGS